MPARSRCLGGLVPAVGLGQPTASNKTGSCSHPCQASLRPRLPSLRCRGVCRAGLRGPGKAQPRRAPGRTGPRARLAPYLAKQRSRALPHAAARWSRAGAGGEHDRGPGGPGGRSPAPRRTGERGGAPGHSGVAGASRCYRPTPPRSPGPRGRAPGELVVPRHREPRGDLGDRTGRPGPGPGPGAGAGGRCVRRGRDRARRGGGGVCSTSRGLKPRAGRRRACPGASCARVTAGSDGYRHRD